MTANDLIESIFKRVQHGRPTHIRVITSDQLKYLRDLIGQDRESGAVRSEGPNVTVWAPQGQYKYIITEVVNGKGHTLARRSNVDEEETGSLFA